MYKNINVDGENVSVVPAVVSYLIYPQSEVLFKTK